MNTRTTTTNVNLRSLRKKNPKPVHHHQKKLSLKKKNQKVKPIVPSNKKYILGKLKREKFKKIYCDIKNKSGFSSINKLYIATGYPRSVVQKWLNEQPTYTLHKKVKKKYKTTRKYRVLGRNIQHQADLVDIQEFKNENDNIGWILTLIDCFSRKAAAVPVKTKSSLNMSNAL